jgi:hypothetical protein
VDIATYARCREEGFLLKKNDIGELICEKCIAKERQINEVLAELNSAQLNIDLLVRI